MSQACGCDTQHARHVTLLTHWRHVTPRTTLTRWWRWAGDPVFAAVASGRLVVG